MKVVLDMISSKKEDIEKKKELLIQDYNQAIKDGNDVTAFLLIDYLKEMNQTIDFLDAQVEAISSIRNNYEFTFDLTGATYQYSQIKSYMLSHGFTWLKDSDYITTEPLTVMEMQYAESEIKREFPWLLEMSTKVYDAVVGERSDVRARWEHEGLMRNEVLEQSLENEGIDGMEMESPA